MPRALHALLAGLLLTASGLSPSIAAAQSPPRPDLAQVLRRLDDLYRSGASIGRVELTVETPRLSRTLRMRIWTRGLDRSLIVIEAPARERGTSTLRVDRNLWNYMPRISRTIRIPPSMMLSSWMGSDFTNDDLVREASYAEDYNCSVAGRSTRPVGWLIRCEAREGLVGLWKRLEMVVDDSGTLPIEARYYDRRLRHARTMRFDQVREMDGRRIPTRMTLVPVDRQGHRTVMRYLDLDFDASVPESTFSLSRLERNR